MKTEVRIGNVTVLFHGNKKEAQATLLAMATLMSDFAAEIRVAAGLKPQPEPIDSRAQVLRTAPFPASPQPKPAPPVSSVGSGQSAVDRGGRNEVSAIPEAEIPPSPVDEMKLRRDAPPSEPAAPAPFLPTADCPPPTDSRIGESRPRFPRSGGAGLINPYRRGGSAPVPQQPKPYDGPRYRSKRELEAETVAATSGGSNHE